jgi:5'-3' exonuclease
MKVHVVDGTYELFRHHFGVPAASRDNEGSAAATRGVLRGVVSLLERGVTHVAVATDHVIESFRNDLWVGYKSSAGMPPELLAQFPLLEEALEAMGVRVLAMVDLEADDALASVAAVAADDPRVEQVLILTPDKDLAQCVAGERVVQVDRRGTEWRVMDEAGVVRRFGVAPASIPDYLALVGDSADGFPGLPGWGPKSAAAVLARYGHLEQIPRGGAAGGEWDVAVRGARALVAVLRECWDAALLFRDLATLRVDRSLVADVEQLRWRGPTPAFADLCERIGAGGIVTRVAALTSA